MAALTLVVAVHLLNVHRIAALGCGYRRIPLILDLLLLGVFTLMLNLLAHPTAGGLGEILPPSVDAKRFVEHAGLFHYSEQETQRLLQQSFRSFFFLAYALVGLLMLWHFVAKRWYKAEFERVGVTWFHWQYVVGWLAILLIALAGTLLMGQKYATPDDWYSMFDHLNVLAFTALVAGALYFVFMKMATLAPNRAQPAADQATVAPPAASDD